VTYFKVGMTDKNNVKSLVSWPWIGTGTSKIQVRKVTALQFKVS